MTQNDKMGYVIELAKKAMNNGELPIAAAIYNGDELISLFPAAFLYALPLLRR